MRDIRQIIVHCTATPEGRHVTVADIRRWHKQRGFNDIGYHWVVDLEGKVWPGRAERLMGAHAVGANRHSIGVVYVGGVDARQKPKDTRTPEQKTALRHILIALKARYPGAEILGHRDVPGVRKACPSFDAREEYAAL